MNAYVAFFEILGQAVVDVMVGLFKSRAPRPTFPSQGLRAPTPTGQRVKEWLAKWTMRLAEWFTKLSARFTRVSKVMLFRAKEPTNLETITALLRELQDAWRD